MSLPWCLMAWVSLGQMARLKQSMSQSIFSVLRIGQTEWLHRRKCKHGKPIPVERTDTRPGQCNVTITWGRWAIGVSGPVMGGKDSREIYAGPQSGLWAVKHSHTALLKGSSVSQKEQTGTAGRVLYFCFSFFKAFIIQRACWGQPWSERED